MISPGQIFMNVVGLFLACLVSILVIVPSTAQAPPDEPDGIDIMFIIDQSGSMGGAAFQGDTDVAADPLNLRFETVTYALDTLGEYRLNFIPTIDVRASLVYFGDDANIMLDWVAIAPDANDDRWSIQRQEFYDRLSVDVFRDQFTPDNLGNTNFLRAMQQANQLFGRLPAGENRIRSIVLITDGAPCVPGEFTCGVLRAEENHLNQVQGYINTQLPGTRLHVIALDEAGRFWADHADTWRMMASSATRVESASQFGVAFRDILSQILDAFSGTATQDDPVELVGGINEVPIDPFQRRIRVSIFKSTTDPADLTIREPNGDLLQPDSPRVERGQTNRPIEVWSIDSPRPGDWEFVLSQQVSDLNVVLDLIPINVVASNVDQDVQQYQSFPIDITLQGADNKSLPVYGSFYQPMLEMTIQSLDAAAAVRTVTMEHISGYTYRGSLFFEQTGDYRLAVSATSRQPDGTPLLLLESEPVGDVRVIGAELTLTSSVQETYLRGDTLSYQGRLVDNTGQRLPYDALSVDIALVDTMGNRFQINTITPDADGNFEGQFILDRTGTYHLRFEGLATLSPDEIRSLALAETDTFQISESDIVRLVLATPDSLSINQYTRDGLPPVQPVPLEIIFETRLQRDNTLIGLQGILPAAGTSPWQVDVLHEGQSVTGEPVETLAPGRYRLIYSDLPPGTYIVTIQPASTRLERPYALALDARRLSLTVTRSRNPLVYVFIGGGLLLLLALLATTVYGVRWYRALRRHPATGTLYLVRVDSREGSRRRIWQCDLDARGLNRLRFGRRQLPDEAPLTELVVTCTSDVMSQSGHIKVTARSDERTLLRNYTMRPGMTADLRDPSTLNTTSSLRSRVRYQLQKDPADGSSSGGSRDGDSLRNFKSMLGR